MTPINTVINSAQSMPLHGRAPHFSLKEVCGRDRSEEPSEEECKEIAGKRTRHGLVSHDDRRELKDFARIIQGEGNEHQGKVRRVIDAPVWFGLLGERISVRSVAAIQR